MKLGKHFDSAEFRCKDGSEHAIDPRLIAMLDDIRDQFGPVQIVSGYRSPAWNKKVGGASQSYHMRGMAADIRVVDLRESEIPSPAKCINPYFHPSELFRYADIRWPDCGLGLYSGWVHIDCRSKRARWGIKPAPKAIGRAFNFAANGQRSSSIIPQWAEGLVKSTKWTIVRALTEITIRWAWRALRDWRISPEELLDLADELIGFAKQRIAEAGQDPAERP